MLLHAPTATAAAALVLFAGLALGQQQNNREFQCPEKPGFYADQIQCDLYYHCSVDGELTEKLCPDGLLFDDTSPSHERCDTSVNVDCGQRTVQQEPKPSKGCPRANGYYRHWDEGSCDKFVNCVDGVANEMPCPPGLIYDDSTSSCAWSTESKRQCTTTKKEVLTDGFSCPEGDVVGPNGRILPHPTFAHPDDCQKFYICRNGVIPQYGSCSAGSVYNDVSFKCDEPENVPGCENYYENEDEKKSGKN